MSVVQYPGDLTPNRIDAAMLQNDDEEELDIVSEKEIPDDQAIGDDHQEDDGDINIVTDQNGNVVPLIEEDELDEIDDDELPFDEDDNEVFDDDEEEFLESADVVEEFGDFEGDDDDF